MLLPLLLPLILPPAPAPDSPIAARIDALAEAHWQAEKVQPAPLTDDTTFLRRVTLDLTGRIPTLSEAKAFAAAQSPDRRGRIIRRLMASPEYALHLGRVLDDLIQGKYAGDAAFLNYLRGAVAAHRPWDQMFRDMLEGPWNTKERKGADRFLLARIKSIDDLTNDTARVFFGVNVSCAKCHDHPLVADWKQDHYYGMEAFLFPTSEGSKGKKDGMIAESRNAEVSFVTKKGERRTARLMFLSNQVVTPSKEAVKSRRALLVRAALEDHTFFRRAVVNQLWAYFLGRGLVQPVDQMHSANPPSVPGLLEWLGDDFAAHGYDLDRLVAGIVASRVYQRASTWPSATEPPADKDFARALLRPLTPEQYALSVLLAVGDERFDRAAGDARLRRRKELEGDSARLTRLQLIDPRSDRFQSSTTEALFMSNHPDVQRLTTAAGRNLAARLAQLRDTGALVDTAVWTVLSRPPEADERAHLVEWIDQHRQGRVQACGELVWALVTSAEFRFNH